MPSAPRHSPPGKARAETWAELQLTYLVCTAPRRWIGDLNLCPGILPDVVDIELITQNIIYRKEEKL